MGRNLAIIGVVVALLVGVPSRAQGAAQGQTAAERFEKLSPEQKEALRAKMREFKALPKEEQERIRGNLERFRKLPPEERERIRGNLRTSSG